MKSFKFKKIDAFTVGISSGNPAACIYLNDIKDISNNEMQLIAKELKGFVNEVVYLFQIGDDIYFKYYSSECEVDFCGHGTVAVMYEYIKSNRILLNDKVIKIKVKNNILDVFNQIKDNDSVYISAPAPIYREFKLEAKSVAASLNINKDTINNNLDLALINSGLNTLIVPINKIDQCLNILPDQLKLKSFCLQNDIDIILVFTNEVSNSNNNYRTRVFAPKYGYLEDPATGSGNSAFGYYLLNRGLWDGKLLTIEQNDNYEMPNIIKLNTINDKVIFGGSAIVKITGEYILA
ncbi:MAG: PhzF family phenazine biosynthesis protein [Spirochaetales bacterium]|nr:PhzF family phenazine biosynthesis protein [Spirochaetales bacterium]